VARLDVSWLLQEHELVTAILTGDEQPRIVHTQWSGVTRRLFRMDDCGLNLSVRAALTIWRGENVTANSARSQRLAAAGHVGRIVHRRCCCARAGLRPHGRCEDKDAK